MISNLIKSFFLLLFLASSLSPAYCQNEDFNQLAQWMTGSFSNAAQAQNDSKYAKLDLHVCKIWKNSKTDLIWLYEEQSQSKSSNKPFKQSIYRISQVSTDTYAVDIYLLPNPAKYAGGWKNPLLFGSLKPDQLIPKHGCTVFLNFDGFATYSGTTLKGHCPDQQKGATYSMLDMTIAANETVMWARGFNSSNIQVWGLKNGGYKFVKADHDQ